MIAPANNSIPS